MNRLLTAPLYTLITELRGISKMNHFDNPTEKLDFMRTQRFVRGSGLMVLFTLDEYILGEQDYKADTLEEVVKLLNKKNRTALPEKLMQNIRRIDESFKNNDPSSFITDEDVINYKMFVANLYEYCITKGVFTEEEYQTCTRELYADNLE